MVERVMRVTLEDLRGLDCAVTSFELNLSAELSLISHLQRYPNKDGQITVNTFAAC